MGFYTQLYRIGCAAYLLFGVAAQAGDIPVVTVIDSGVDYTDGRIAPYICKERGLFNLTGVPMEEDAGHGTHVVGIIIQNSPPVGYCLRVIKVFSKSQREGVVGRMIKAVQLATGSILTNISAGGPVFYESEYNAMQAIKTLFIMAAGNEGSDLLVRPFYPASYRIRHSVVVGSLEKNGRRIATNSNRGLLVNTWEIGEDVRSYAPGGKFKVLSGTSMATARHTARLLTKYLNANR